MSRALVVSTAAAALFLTHAPAAANVVPDAMVYFNVQPYGSPYCESEIWDCSQMHPTTPDQGLVEFQVFLACTDPNPLTGFSADLYWPDAWGLYDGSFCSDGQGSLNSMGPNPHHLDMTFPCTHRPYLFLALTLVFDVQGYGTLDPRNTSRVWIGCPPSGFWVEAGGFYGEAGTSCEYTNQPCSLTRFFCIPDFSTDHLDLVAPVGGRAHGVIPFSASWGSEGQYGCGSFDVHTQDPWCTGHVEDGKTEYRKNLIVDADATGLDQGTYHAEVQVEWGQQDARCVQVNLDVTKEAGVRLATITRSTWGRIRMLYR